MCISKEHDWKSSMTVYLLLKGKWGTFTQEMTDLRKWSKQPYWLCKEVINSLVALGKIKLKSSLPVGLYQQLSSGYKHSYNPDTFSFKVLATAIDEFQKSVGRVPKTSHNSYSITTGRGGIQSIHEAFRFAVKPTV